MARKHTTVADLKVGDTFHAWHGSSERTVLALRPMLTFIDVDVALPGGSRHCGTWHLLGTEEVTVAPWMTDKEAADIVLFDYACI